MVRCRLACEDASYGGERNAGYACLRSFKRFAYDQVPCFDVGGHNRPCHHAMLARSFSHFIFSVAVSVCLLPASQVACMEDGRHYRPNHHAMSARFTAD